MPCKGSASGAMSPPARLPSLPPSFKSGFPVCGPGGGQHLQAPHLFVLQLQGEPLGLHPECARLLLQRPQLLLQPPGGAVVDALPFQVEPRQLQETGSTAVKGGANRPWGQLLCWGWGGGAVPQWAEHFPGQQLTSLLMRRSSVFLLSRSSFSSSAEVTVVLSEM